MELATVLKLQSGNGMGLEDSQMIIEGMAQQGAEPTYCMGDDIPLPVLSSRPHVMYDYFKQRFAQVGILCTVHANWLSPARRAARIQGRAEGTPLFTITRDTQAGHHFFWEL